MSKIKEKSEAIKLRKSGKSISEIASILGVSKGSVSTWCREIILTKAQKAQLHASMVKAGNIGRQKGADQNRQKKEEKIQQYEKEGKNMFSIIKNKERFLIGLGLYWGEGIKTHNSATGFSNSDPQSVVFMKKWFSECLDVLESDFIPRIYLNESHKNREKDVLRFWANLLELPTSQFGNTVFVKTKNKKIYSNRDKYKGVMLLTVRKGSRLKYKILGLIKGLHE